MAVNFDQLVNKRPPEFTAEQWLQLLVALDLGTLGETTDNYVQPTDPGAVGATKRWWDTSTKTIKVRNASNTDWDSWSGVFGP